MAPVQLLRPRRRRPLRNPVVGDRVVVRPETGSGDFVLVDPETGFVPRAPRIAQEAFATYRFGPLTLYLFEDDVARRLDRP